MRVSFIKMHGLGNDFVVLDARTTPLHAISREFAAKIADRTTGIGCDQLIVLEGDDAADLRMRIFNADGGEVESCGNAARAVAILLGKPARVATLGGTIELDPRADGARVNMGQPRFGWEQIPLAYAMDTQAMPVSWNGLENPAAINVGNPHVIFFVEDSAAVALDVLGPQIENDPLFPERVNVNVAHIANGEVHLRVWERGAGLTRACGTGACATAVAAIRRGLVQSPVSVHLPGGALEIAWDGQGDILMSGPACESFRGSFEWDDFA